MWGGAAAYSPHWSKDRSRWSSGCIAIGARRPIAFARMLRKPHTPHATAAPWALLGGGGEAAAVRAVAGRALRWLLGAAEKARASAGYSAASTKTNQCDDRRILVICSQECDDGLVLSAFVDGRAQAESVLYALFPSAQKHRASKRTSPDASFLRQSTHGP